MDNYRTFSHTVIGASHIKDNKACQDYSLNKITNDYAIAIVCDGHGGDKYFRSDRGSRIAAHETLESIEEWMKEYLCHKDDKEKESSFLAQPNTFLKQLINNIIYRWHEKITEDYIREPFITNDKDSLKSMDDLHKFIESEKWVKAYGTTLIAVVLTSSFWFGIHIGDGKCVAIDELWNSTQPIPWDEACFLNQTTSLCDERASEKFRFFFSKENLPIVIYAASDGVDDTYTTNETLYNFYNNLTKLFVDKGMEDGLLEMQEFLPIMSEKGSRDDISIAGILNFETLKEQRKDKESFETSVEELPIIDEDLDNNLTVEYPSKEDVENCQRYNVEENVLEVEKSEAESPTNKNDNEQDLSKGIIFG